MNFLSKCEDINGNDSGGKGTGKWPKKLKAMCYDYVNITHYTDLWFKDHTHFEYKWTWKRHSPPRVMGVAGSNPVKD